jgi:hypothetical protein
VEYGEDFLPLVQSRLKELGVPFKKSISGLYFTDPDSNLELAFWPEETMRASGSKFW